MNGPLKWFGGKHYLASRIIASMPRHLHYVEPFAGGLAVLLARDPDDSRLWWGDNGNHRGVSEVVNDLDGGLTNFWSVLADPRLFPEFFRRVAAIPLSRDAWVKAATFMDAENFGNPPDPVDQALAFFVCCRQSRAGMRKTFTTLSRNRTRRGMNGNASEWLGAVDGLPDVHRRLRSVVVENVDAMKLIQREDAASTLFYCDPPYLHGTRATTDGYAHEMSEKQHRELLSILACLQGKFILSGYPSPLYDDAAAKYGWRAVDIAIANHAAGGESKRRMTERLYLNYAESEVNDAGRIR